MPFGRTELSLRLFCIEFRALFHRRGSEGPGVQGMPEKSLFHVFSKKTNLTVFLERKSAITGVPFGRTELSICGIGTDCCALLHRHGPVGPSFQGMPDKLTFCLFLLYFYLLSLFVEWFSMKIELFGHPLNPRPLGTPPMFKSAKFYSG